MPLQDDILLMVDKISVGYGDLKVLWDVSIKLPQGRIITVLGPNSAGKSTLLKTIAGLLSPHSGNIIYRGNTIIGLPAEKIVCELGISYVPHLPGLIFPSLTVKENLELSVARLNLRRDEFRGRLKKIFDLFPALEGLLNRSADRLSGGERQMLNIAMGLMRNPQVLMLDEPSAGLAPKLKNELFEKIKVINKQGTAIILVEQDVVGALSISDYGYVLKGGHVTSEGEADLLLKKKESLYF